MNSPQMQSVESARMSRGGARKGTGDSQYTLSAAAADAVGWAVTCDIVRQAISIARTESVEECGLTIRGRGDG